MKKNKKALMGMLVAIILSMGAMGGYNSNIESVSPQQVAVSCASVAGSSEGAKAGAFGVAAAATVGGIVSGVGVSMIKTSVPASMTPLGWYGVAAGLIL